MILPDDAEVATPSRQLQQLPVSAECNDFGWLGVQMSEPTMRELSIDSAVFLQAASRDLDFHDKVPQTTYLDLTSGGMDWLFDKDRDADDEGTSAEDNRELRQRIEANPQRYLLIPGLTHGEQHELLQEFLASDWTDDELVRDSVNGAYYGSIGGWKDSLEDEGPYWACVDYRDARVKENATNLLQARGIQPIWR